MDPFDVGDPYIEWNETNAAQESPHLDDFEDYYEKEENMFDVDQLKSEVTKLLVSDFEMLIEEAEEAVKDSLEKAPSVWNENVDARELASLLAGDDEDE